MPRQETSRVGGVVIGGDYQGLGIARSLGRAGAPVFVVDDERSIARYSRYVGGHLRVPDLRDEAVAVEQLLEAGRRFQLQGWVLYPTRDEHVSAFSRFRERLAGAFRVPTPHWSTIQWTSDKRNTYRRAEELDIPIPRTWFALREADLDRVDGAYPLVVKPAIKEHFFYASRVKAWRADDAGQLHELFNRADGIIRRFGGSPGEVMIQDLVPGGGSQQFSYCAFFKQGEAVGSMVARRLRQHPVEFGRASTYVETVEVPELETLSQRFLRSIDYYGLVEMEYKLDPRDGRYRLLDVNARTWGYHALGSAAGVDFAAMLHADQCGQPLERRRARTGVRWVRLLTDLPVGVVEIGARNLSLWSYARSLASSDVRAVFSAADPLPGLAEVCLAPYLFARRGF